MKKRLAVTGLVVIFGFALYYKMNNEPWTQEQCKADDAFNRAKSGECRNAGYK